MKNWICLLCILLLSGTLAAQSYYTGVYGANPHCQGCHAQSQPPLNQYGYWNNTPHAHAYDNHPGVQWNANCLPCHTTGWNTALPNHGFDDYFFSGDTAGMQEMRNVQCEVCHGPTSQIPHSSSTTVSYHAEVCGGCHTGVQGKHTYEEWQSREHGHVASASAQQLACAKCHEAQSASVFLSTGLPPVTLPQNPTWQVTCAACHGTHSRNLFGHQQYLPGDSLCRSCHTMDGAVVGQVPHAPQKEMLLGIGNGGYEFPGYTYSNSCHDTYLPEACTICHMYTSNWGNPDTTTTGHQVTPIIQTCAIIGCHNNQIPPDSSFNIMGCQTEADSLLSVLAAALAQADTTTLIYRQAKFNYEFVMNDGSHGVHNSFYSHGLLESSIQVLTGQHFVTITLTPINPPIRIPAPGGSFQYNINIHNLETAPVTMDIWIMMKQLPNGPWTGPYLNAARTLPGGANPTRLRTQNIVGSLAPGTYLYEGRVGDYPNTIWNFSNFTFTKLSAGAGLWMNDFENYGEDFYGVEERVQRMNAEQFAVYGATPNPFNPTTVISYELGAANFVNLSVYDISGRKVAELVNGMRDAGTQSVTFDASDLASGIYLYKLEAGNFTTTKKLILLK